MMLDFIGFTKLSTEQDPAVIVAELNDIFTAFDRISEQFGCERIKTMGDAYLAVSGMPAPNPDHARAGWYADPSGAPATLRYWNGSDWTDHYHQIPGDNDLRDPHARPARGRGRRRRGPGIR